MQRVIPVVVSSAGTNPVLLEGLWHTHDRQGRQPAAVVCHPHPLGEGSMHNAVVAAIAGALCARGVPALRFNFRGVGNSGGLHDNGRGEQADIAGALEWVLSRPEVDPERVALVGYSFGAWVSLVYAQDDARVVAVAAVCPAAWHYDQEFLRTRARPDLGVEAWQCDPGLLKGMTRRKLFITGEHDAFAPPAHLQRLVERIPEPKEMHVIAGTNHFLRGHEREVGELVAEFLAGG